MNGMYKVIAYKDLPEWCEVRWYFYRKQCTQGDDSIIIWWTKKYNPWVWNYPLLESSHAEFYLGPDDMAYSSSSRKDWDTGQAPGTRLCSAQGVMFKHPENWYYYKCWVPKIVYNGMRYHCVQRACANEGYDWAAIGSYVLPIRVHSLRKNICSEAVHNVNVETVIVYPQSFTDEYIVQPECWKKSYWNVPSPIRESGYFFIDNFFVPYDGVTNEPIYKRNNHVAINITRERIKR